MIKFLMKTFQTFPSETNFENWEDRGALWAHDRAHNAYKQILDEFEAPPIDKAIDEELQAFIAKRVEEGGAPTDF